MGNLPGIMQFADVQWPSYGSYQTFNMPFPANILAPDKSSQRLQNEQNDNRGKENSQLLL